MLGKNRIAAIKHLDNVINLDVLDLHNNNIEKIENLGHLKELRVLNLAGNKIVEVDGVAMSGMKSLAEVNLRRNVIGDIKNLNAVPSLQRIFLSANQIFSFDVVDGVLAMPQLVELSLDGNPVCAAGNYRSYVVSNAPNLRHVDMRRVTEEERRAAHQSGTLDRDSMKDTIPPPVNPAQQQPVPPPPTPPKPITSVVEYDVASQRLLVTGSNADSTLERMPTDAITSVYFDSIPCDRAVRIFAPKLMRFTSITTYRFSNNGLHSLDQLALLPSLPRVIHLEIVKNEIVECMPTMFPLFCCAMFPLIQTLNGSTLTSLDIQKGKLIVGGIPRPPCKTPPNNGAVDAQGLFPAPIVYDGTVVRGVEFCTDQILAHCNIVEKKVRGMDALWPGIIHRLVTDTLHKSKDGTRHDDIYKLT
jgi:hypothetical protein